MSGSPGWRLYGTVGCHLCEQALEQIAMVVGFERVRDAVVSIDIADDDDLLDKYQERIPVLVCMRTQQTLDWPFDPAELQQWLGDGEPNR